jgi:hypothetical protein
MYINDSGLKKDLQKILINKTRNKIVLDIKAKGLKFHQLHIDRFIEGKPISLSTLKKIESYVLENL